METKVQRAASGAVAEECRRPEEGGEWRCWDGLNPEVLALIFTRLPAEELVRTVSFVCRGWRAAVSGPYCWSDIDIHDWCCRIGRPDFVGVRKLVRRSAGNLRRLSAYRIGNWGFSFTASLGKHLKVLQIPMSEVNDQTLQKYSRFLTALEVLDISHCKNITSKGIEMLGKSCRCLINLKRTMCPPEYESTQDNGVAAKIDEEEALAVGNFMPGLEQLELAFGRFSDCGLDVILTNCKALWSLDISGCWNVQLSGDIGFRCDALRAFKDPYFDPYELDPPTSGEETGEEEDEDSDVEEVD